MRMEETGPDPALFLSKQGSRVPGQNWDFAFFQSTWMGQTQPRNFQKEMKGETEVTAFVF